MAWLLLLLGLLASEACAVAAQAQAQPLINNKNIFILGGQSNMAGRGGVTNSSTWDGVVPPQCSPNPGIVRLDAHLNWVEAREPLHVDIDSNKTNGVGPAMAFANSVLKKRPAFGVVGLVPCAIGGTNISQWQRGKPLYKNMIKRVNASLHGADGDVATLQALLWFQGESDTLILTDAQSYRARIQKFFFDLRRDLNSPLLPIIQVALASGEGPYIDIVREAQLDMDFQNLRTVDAKGLPLGPDGLHLTTPAQVHLGQMMADAFLQFVPTSSNSNPNYSPIRNQAPPTCLHNSASHIYLFPIFITLLIFMA